MKILISACLLGLPTRYDGGNSFNSGVAGLAARHDLVPVCPEQLGGLPTPREACELCGDRVMDRLGCDRTREFHLGAEAALKVFEMTGCQAAILKSRSPSCGSGPIYDGSFSGVLVNRPGTLAERLQALGIPVHHEDEIDKLE